MRVFVTGGTGLVGTRLVGKLLDRGDQVVVLTRRFGHARQALGTKVELVEGDPMKAGDWASKLDDCDGVVHLAGENVFAKRWNDSFKQLLVESRTISTRNIANAITAAVARKDRRAEHWPKVLVNASAIGIYGPHGDEELTEESPVADDFLAKLCVDWEQEARAPESAGVRCVQVRVGVVLDRDGGPLAKMLTPFKLFVGGPIGSGKQYMSWIHQADLIGLILLALDNQAVNGPLNGTAPNPLSNREFARVLGKTMGRPSFMWTPGFALNLVLGGVASVVTTGQRVLPKRGLAHGYAFEYPTAEVALAELLKR